MNQQKAGDSMGASAPASGTTGQLSSALAGNGPENHNGKAACDGHRFQAASEAGVSPAVPDEETLARIGERRLTWPDRLFYGALFAGIAWLLFGVETTFK